MLQPTWLNVGTYLIYSIVVASSSMSTFAVHTHRFALDALLYLALVFVPLGIWLFWSRAQGIRAILSSKYFWLLCLLLFTAFDEVRYVKRNLNHPEKVSAAPALIDPARAMLHGKDPYTVRLLGGAGISPGPGWILLLAPLTLIPGGAGLITGLSTLLTGWLIGAHSLAGRGLFSLLILLQIVLVQVGTWGSDLFAIPMVYAALWLLAVRWSGRPRPMIFLGVVAGLFAQSRVPMVSLLLLLGLALWRRNRSDARFLMLPALSVCGTMYVLFYLWTVHDHVFFQPFHLLHRERASGLAPTLLGPLAGVIVLVWIFAKMRGSLEAPILAGGLLLLAVFGPTGLGELANVAPHLELWEGANYLALGMSLLAAYLALRMDRGKAGMQDDARPSGFVRRMV